MNALTRGGVGSCSSGCEEDQVAPTCGGLSRRQLLGGAALTAAIAAAAPTLARGSGVGEGPLIRIDKTYRALLRRPGATGAARIERVKLHPFGGRQVLVRCTAMQCCYSDVRSVLGIDSPQPPFPPGPPRAQVLGHQGMGVVEAIGPQVRGVKPGDKVFISVTPNCGWCYNCLRGRADACYGNALPAPTIGELEDGTPVAQGGGGGGIGGMAEYSINYEERLTPIFTPLEFEVLAPLTCPGSTGLGMTSSLHAIESGSTVVVFGCGPVGLSAIQGARIQGATKIIALDPIAMRREIALKVGATDAIDPNIFGDGLVDHLREMTHTPTDRIFVGGRSSSGYLPMQGPDYVIEAVGRQAVMPKVESTPDPSGVKALEQAWSLVPPTGFGMTAGFGYKPDDMVKFNARLFTNGSKTLVSCQNGGIQSRRDLPRFVRLLEQGKFDTKSLTTHVYGFDDILKAYQEVGDRTVVCNVVTFG